MGIILINIHTVIQCAQELRRFFRAFHDPVLRLVIIAALSTHLLKVTDCIALLALKIVFGGWALLLAKFRMGSSRS